MDFAEYWKETWLKMDFPETAHDVERIVRSAYRAGLLHAAEQDRNKSMKNYPPSQRTIAAYCFDDSAEAHEQAANDLK